MSISTDPNGPPAAGVAARPDRGVVAIGGREAEAFLHGIFTGTVKALAPGEARFSALLNPQGKVLYDFFLIRQDDGFLVEIERAQVPAFLKRLTFYRLRAEVTLADRSDDFAVFIAWGPAPDPDADGAIVFTDPRLAALGRHVLVPAPAAGVVPTAALEAWHRHRLALGVPESSVDFTLGEFFPHDVDMDDLGGVDFKKGCFVGQEVVSRMKHRGTARKRFVLAEAIPAGTELPTAGSDVLAGEKGIGTLGSSIAGRGIAAVRLDRARAALDAGVPVTCGGIRLDLAIPAFAGFGWPAPVEE
ncbi:folate-binding protein [Siculibacillus lacustris]|uniref:Folate-binding protein n=1 Tax=Siculibacillus lacustris TaxID=1549641 RepID=A0A4Q9VH54_9HYPH|nr:folate-binding protein YgfZ [Siculibacillus lacustris]TBW34421.1 folate-binding protein [Siculibacillus lacustris]